MDVNRCVEKNTLIVLRIDTVIHVFMGYILSFYQYGNNKSSQFYTLDLESDWTTEAKSMSCNLHIFANKQREKQLQCLDVA